MCNATALRPALFFRKCEQMNMRRWLRFFYGILLAAALFLALSPGPWGQIITSSEQRHILAFGLLPLISVIAWPRISPFLQFVAYAVLGGAIELVQQTMNVGRRAEWADWGWDIVAAAIAIAIAGGMRQVIGRARRRGGRTAWSQGLGRP